MQYGNTSKKNALTPPSWLPAEHTFEEKQALEEEELAKTLSKRMKARGREKGREVVVDFKRFAKTFQYLNVK